MLVVEAVFSLPLILCPRRLSSRFYRYDMLPCLIKHLVVEQLPFPFIGAGQGLNQLVLHGYHEHAAVYLVLVHVVLVGPVVCAEGAHVEITNPKQCLSIR